MSEATRREAQAQLRQVWAWCQGAIDMDEEELETALARAVMHAFGLLPGSGTCLIHQDCAESYRPIQLRHLDHTVAQLSSEELEACLTDGPCAELRDAAIRELGRRQ